MSKNKRNLVLNISVPIFIGFLILGCILMFVFLPKENSKASTDPNKLFETNLLSSGTTINKDNADVLCALFNNAGDTLDWQQLCTLNGGKPIIFPMGTIPGINKTIYWEVVYKSGDFITVWMTDNYTVEYFNNNGKTYEDGIWGGNLGTNFGNVANYSQSTLRETVNQIYYDLIEMTAYPLLDYLIVSPQDAMMVYQQGSAQYNVSTKFRYANTGTTYYSHHNGMLNQTNIDEQYYNWIWDNSVYDDKLWIPSYFEVWNSGGGTVSSEVGRQYFDGGYWNFSEYENIGFDTLTLDGPNNISKSWLRSGESSASQNAIVTMDIGGVNNANASTYCGVRPAVHLSLENIYLSTQEYAISAICNGNGSVSIDPNISKANGGTSITLSAVAENGYVVDYWAKVVDGVESIWTPHEDDNLNTVVDVVTVNTIYKVYFVKQYVLTIISGNTDYGVVVNVLDSNIGGVMGKFDAGTVFKYRAVPNSGIVFKHWQDANGTVVSTQEVLNVELQADSVYIAIFEVSGTSANAVGGGSVYIEINESDGVVTLIATPYSGYYLVGWSCSDGTDISRYTVDSADNKVLTMVKIPQSLVENKIIIATFEQQNNV